MTPSDIHPCLTYQDAHAALAWLCEAWVSPTLLPATAQTLSVYVPDPDAHCKQALAAGARLVRPLRTEEYGARGYRVADVEGHLWYFGNYRPGEFWNA
jgi:uncharacterized glyoxalase superfamily protein PhnB